MELFTKDNFEDLICEGEHMAVNGGLPPPIKNNNNKKKKTICFVSLRHRIRMFSTDDSSIAQRKNMPSLSV